MTRPWDDRSQGFPVKQRLEAPREESPARDGQAAPRGVILFHRGQLVWDESKEPHPAPGVIEERVSRVMDGLEPEPTAEEVDRERQRVAAERAAEEARPPMNRLVQHAVATTPRRR